MFILGFVIGFSVAGAVGWFLFKGVHDQLVSQYQGLQVELSRLKAAGEAVKKAV